MPRLKTVLLSVLVVGFLGAKAEDRKPHYLATDAIVVKALLPDPPAPGSEEQAAELELVLRLQTNRTEAVVQRCRSEEKLSPFNFAAQIGPWFTPENCPRTAVLFSSLEADAKYFTHVAKENWKRQRPFVMDERVKPAVVLENEPGYPSGHSVRGILFARILSELFPDKKADLLNRGRQIGWDRVIAGMHFPSDVYAGRTLGHAVARALLANPEFRHDLEAAKQEIEHAATAQPAGR